MFVKKMQKTDSSEKVIGGVFQLSGLVDSSNPEVTLNEVVHLAVTMKPGFKKDLFVKSFRDIQKLFAGAYPGYQACNTYYHDFRHTMMVLLAMARLMHGATLQGVRFSEKEINLGLISALMHDTGYIQSIDDLRGTGAKYTLIHTQRSVQFIENYFAGNPYFTGDVKNFRDIVGCTEFNTMIDDREFTSENIALLGKMMGTADLLGQMADRLYLEKLLLLYDEFTEGGVPGFDSEIDLFRKTVSFYKKTKSRFENEYGNVSRFMIDHFRERWNIDENVYEDYIEKNINYLKFVLKSSQKNITDILRRNAISFQ
jgi:hypothetical protein